MNETRRNVVGNTLEETAVLSREEMEMRIKGMDMRIEALNQSIIRTKEEKAELEEYLTQMSD